MYLSSFRCECERECLTMCQLFPTGDPFLDVSWGWLQPPCNPQGWMDIANGCSNCHSDAKFRVPLEFICWHLLFSVWCSTVSSILGAWLDQYSEDFWTPPNYDCLHQLLSYLHRHFLGSDLERRARNLLAHFHRRQQCEPDPDGMKGRQGRDSRIRGSE